MSDTDCMITGCGDDWAVVVELFDGRKTCVCEPHADELADELAGEIRSITGTWGMSPAAGRAQVQADPIAAFRRRAG
jgi:hypothetical protein